MERELNRRLSPTLTVHLVEDGVPHCVLERVVGEWLEKYCLLKSDTCKLKLLDGRVMDLLNRGG